MVWKYELVHFDNILQYLSFRLLYPEDIFLALQTLFTKVQAISASRKRTSDIIL